MPPLKNKPHVYEGTRRELTAAAGDDEAVIVHHPTEDCSGDAELGCPMHRPSDHPLKDAPMRLGEYGIERQCEHGGFHPDPDSIDYLYAFGTDSDSSIAAMWSEHPCDGCCEYPNVTAQDMAATRRQLKNLEKRLSKGAR